MTTNEEAPEAAKESPAPSDDASRSNEAAITIDPADTLSPAVRRLVRQYDLDITGIHGTGPEGRIRVGDVISVLGPRAASTRFRSRTIPVQSVAPEMKMTAGTAASVKLSRRFCTPV